MLIPVLLLLLGAVPSPGDTVARVNGAPITERELEAAVARLIPQYSFHQNLTAERRMAFRKQALESLIGVELQYQDAVRRGLKPDQAAVKEEIKKLRDRYESRKSYEDALKQAGLDDEQLQARIEKNVLVGQVRRVVVYDPARMTDEELAAYYHENIAKFRQPESVRLRIISAQEKSKAEEALKRVKSGEDFGDVAARMSEDQYRIKGGDIGFVHRGRIYPELEKAAFALKKGQISGLIPAEGKWYILKLEERSAERTVPFAEIKDKLKQELESKRAREIAEKWMKELRSKAKIEILLKTDSND